MHKFRLFLFVLFISAISISETAAKDSLFNHSKSVQEQDLIGCWKAKSSSIEYPVFINSKKYMKISGTSEDTTSEWENHAILQNTSIDMLLEKKYVSITEIYKKDYPLVDSNGINNGIIISVDNSKIYKTEIWYIPEEIVISNLSNFKVASNHKKLTIKNSLKLNSDVFKNLHLSGNYKKQ